MNKPLGYYTDTTQPEIAALEEEHGSHLQGMSQEAKLDLIIDTAQKLKNQPTEANQVGVIKAVADNL